MLSPKERIQRQVLHKESEELDFFGWVDIFMSEYKMSFEEFKRLKIPAFHELRNAMQKRYEKQKKIKKKPKGRR